KQQKKQVEHQLEVEKKANNEKQRKLNTDLYHMKRSLRYYEDESKDVAGYLQHSLQRIAELERALCCHHHTGEEGDQCDKALIEWQLEQSIQEKARLKAHLTWLKESLKQVQLERDEYAQHIKGEQRQQRMRKMSQEVCTLKKEKKHDTCPVEKRERSLCKLKNQRAEPLLPDPPAMPSEVELQNLRKQLERMAGELQAQMENNQRISVLNWGQKERLQEQEKRLQQLAKPQSGFKELNNENKSALQLEHQVKELQEKLGEERLEAARLQNQQLKAQLRPLWPTPTGDGGGHLDSEEEEAPRPMLTVPEDLESWEAMSSFMDLLEEKTDLTLSSHRKVHHLIVEPGDSAKDAAPGGGLHQAGPGQQGDEGEAAGAAGDDAVACGDYNEEHSKFLATAQNPADEPSPGAPAPQELGAANKHGDLCEVSLTDSVEPAQGEARDGSPHGNRTSQPIVQDHQEHPGLGFCWTWLLRRRR
uniref:Golgin subfamily A conserved domain-containing protein n=1 Tax=Mandrillus leucophaeus TaxID=9568 RepID=A0A2K5YKB7_MANLE